MDQPPTELEVLRDEVDLLAGGVHTLADAIAHRGDADLSAHVRLLARQAEAVVERVEQLGTKGARR